jgi:hypothetical protein
MKPFLHSVVLFFLILGLLSGCEEKLDLSTLPQPETSVIDTAYVRFDPPFGGYAGAEDIMVGNDQLLYVADTRANRIVMLNRAGQFLSARQILAPLSLAQDSRLDLLIGGSLLAVNGDTVGALFRVHLVSLNADSAHHLDLARIETLWVERAHPQRRFPGLTVFGDNTYLAVRTGPDNSSFIDPDARVLLFDADDRFITPIPALNTRIGSGITDMYQPTAIASFPGVKDFILAQLSDGVAYGAIWLRYEHTADFDGWLPKFDPTVAGYAGVDFIRPNQFLAPSAVAIDKSRRDVFIADAGLDSIFKFTSRGTFKAESFGRVRSGGMLQRPTGLAFFEQVLYVLDAPSGLILRYRLSTDVPR